MIVVSDTSPLRYLVVIEQSHLLRDLFGQVLVPPAVARELAAEKAPVAVRALMLARPIWLVLRSPDRIVVDAVQASAPQLGAGEIEAIALAKELQADLLLADERQATREARSRYKLRVTGVLGVLEAGAAKGLVELPKIIRMLQRTNYRMPREIVAQLLERDAMRRSAGDA